MTLIKAGEIMGLDVIDHIIVCENDFASLKEKGLM
jgi:DNA repair protein RadC